MIPLVALLASMLHRNGDLETLARAAASGRAVALYANVLDVRGVPPGQPPVLRFRYLEGAERHRFGDLDLVVDDAGH